MHVFMALTLSELVLMCRGKGRLDVAVAFVVSLKTSEKAIHVESYDTNILKLNSFWCLSIL